MITKTKRNENEMTFDEPIAQVFEDLDNESSIGDKKPEDDRYEKLANQLAELQTRLSESEKTNMALLTSPQRYSQVNDAPIEVKPESVALPDPALDPEGYDKAKAERDNIRYENRRRQEDFKTRQERSNQNKIDGLWDDFADRFPDIDDKERIDFVATKVAQDALKRGLDVERYMFVTRDKFMNDVAKKYEDVFGLPEVDDENNEEDTRRSSRAASRPRGRPRANNRNRQEDEYVGRTAGVFGGNESGGRPSRGGEEDTGPSMIDDIQAIQRKTGFF